MNEERKGFFTPEQEVKLDEFLKLEGIYEATDGVVIKLTDNIVLQKLKEKLLEKNPEMVDMVETVIDEIFQSLE
jgi:regulator of PEP synthase PpsR (kinase-PPPase family)